MAVKTQYGISHRETVTNIVTQGDPQSPIECSNQIDTICKECLEPDMEHYKYKNEVKIPALDFLDDIITVSESGYKTSIMNSFKNAKIATKNLQFEPQKCFVMHIGKTHEDAYKNGEFYVDCWKMREMGSVETGGSEWKDMFDGLNEI